MEKLCESSLFVLSSLINNFITLSEIKFLFWFALCPRKSMEQVISMSLLQDLATVIDFTSSIKIICIYQVCVVRIQESFGGHNLLNTMHHRIKFPQIFITKANIKTLP